MARKLSLDLQTETLEQTELAEKKLEQKEVNHDKLNHTILNAENLEPTETTNKINEPKELTQAVPDIRQETKKLPSIGHPENVVTVDGIDVEIKPTRFGYFRNKFTTYYKYLKQVPIDEFLGLGEGTFGNDLRSGDQVVFDFLCAVFDDPYFVQDHYDNMDADLLDKILEIFGRVNHIKDKEDNAKNRQAQTTA